MEGFVSVNRYTKKKGKNLRNHVNIVISTRTQFSWRFITSFKPLPKLKHINSIRQIGETNSTNESCPRFKEITWTRLREVDSPP